MTIHTENLFPPPQCTRNPLSRDVWYHPLKHYLLHWTLTGLDGYKQGDNRGYLYDHCHCQMGPKMSEFRLLWPFFFFYSLHVSKEFCKPKCHKDRKCWVQVKTYKLSKLQSEVFCLCFPATAAVCYSEEGSRTRGWFGSKGGISSGLNHRQKTK